MPGKDKDKQKDAKADNRRQGQKGKSASKSTLAKAGAAAKAGEKKRRATGERRRGSLKEYFKGVKIETKKVVWPTRKELISYTVVVLFTCAFFGLMIWGVDSAFLAALRELVGIDL
jgi:preprotein translocase subunit SecE